MTERRSLSPMKRLAVFEAALGRCHICGLCIKGVSDPWDVEHIIPLALGGADDASNMAPAHKACHAGKTAADVAGIAKSKRMKARHIGIRQSGNPMPGSKQSKWKKRMNGEVILR